MKKTFLLIAIAILFKALPSVAQGCMESSSSTGGPGIIGYIQGENITDFLGKDALGNSLNKNTFQFRRARIGVTGSIPYNFSYYVMTEFSPISKGPYILDAFITYKPIGNYAKLSVGQFKSPFGLELSTPCQSLYTVDRSMVVNELAFPFRDQGVMLSGSSDSLKIFGINKKDIFSYSLAITNGTGLNVSDNNRSKDIIGRVVFAPCNFFQVGGSFHKGKGKNPDASVTEPDKLTRWGADVQLKKSFGKFDITSQTEYIFGEDKGSKLEGGGCGADPVVVKGTFERNGIYSQLMMRTPWKFEPVLKYERYDPDGKLAYDDPKNYLKETWTFGLNYYINDWTRLQVNYLYRMEGSSSTDLARYNEKMNDMLILQLQVKLN